MIEKIKLSPGLLTLRYTAPAEGVADAVIRPFVPPASRNAITLMFEPGNHAGALSAPGQICVISCSRSAILGLEIGSRTGDSKGNGGMEIDYLSEAKEHAEAPRVASDVVVYLDGFGDRPGRFGDWIKGDAPSHAISGLMMRPRSLSSRIMLRDPGTDQIVAPGDYLGSRTGFRPLTGLQLWIDEPDGRSRLHVQAEFAEAGRVDARGTLVTLHGGSNTDRLLAINIALEAISGTDGSATTSPISEPGSRAGGSAQARTDQVRIFRKS